MACVKFLNKGTHCNSVFARHSESFNDSKFVALVDGCVWQSFLQAVKFY